MTDELWVRAIHEAAHAVFSYELGVPVQCVTLQTEERPDQRDMCLTEEPPSTPQGHLRAAGVAMAGAYAEGYLFSGSSTGLLSFEELKQAAEEDAADPKVAGPAESVNILCLLVLAARGAPDPEGEARRLYEGLLEVVGEYVPQHWREITRVAQRLLQTGYLNGEDVAAICQGHR